MLCFFISPPPYFKIDLMNVEQLLDESVARGGRLPSPAQPLGPSSPAGAGASAVAWEGAEHGGGGDGDGTRWSVGEM